MNKKWDFIELQLPEYSLSAIINNDYSGLDAEDISLIAAFLKDLPLGGCFSDITGQEPYFSHYPEFGKACNVYDIEYHFPS